MHRFDTMSNVVRDFSQECWNEVMNRIIGAVVFLDDPSAENLHWHGGLTALLEAGAVAVKALSPFESATNEQKKAVFISSCFDTQLQSMKEIIKSSNFTQCIVVSTASLDVVGAEIAGDTARDGGDINPTRLIENMILEWINKKQSSVEVIHIPIFTISLTPLTFLTPTFATMFPTFQGKLRPDNSSLDLYSLSEKERSMVRRLAGCLSSMLGALNIKEDVFYMGPFSSLIAGVLEYNPVCAARRKSCTRPASLVIVDRSLDMCSTTSHASDNLLDKILSVLPHLPGHSTDVAVDMSSLCEANVISVVNDVQLSPGCLWHNDEVCVQTFQHLMNKTQKEVLFHLHNKLSTIDVTKSPSHTAQRVTPGAIEKIVSSAKGDYAAIERQAGLLQQALCVTQSARLGRESSAELVGGLEGQARQNLVASGHSTSVLLQISQLIKSRKERNLQLQRLLSLCVYVYSLAGPDVSFAGSHEDALRHALGAAFFEDHAALFPEEQPPTPEGCAERAEAIMERLREAGRIRQILNKYQSVLKPTASGGTEYKGVLQQLMEDVLDPSRPELPDLKHRNEGIKDLLRTGFNMLLSSGSKKHPLDNGTVLVLVVGGATARECAELQHAVIASGTDARVVVGATALAGPVAAARTLLGM